MKQNQYKLASNAFRRLIKENNPNKPFISMCMGHFRCKNDAMNQVTGPFHIEGVLNG